MGTSSATSAGAATAVGGAGGLGLVMIRAVSVGIDFGASCGRKSIVPVCGGAFTASGKAKLPFASGVVGAAAGMEREQKVEYFFDARRDEALYAASVAERLGKLPRPLDLRSIWAAFEESDLAGLSVQTSGKSSFSVDVSLAEPLALLKGADTANIASSANTANTANTVSWK